MRAQSRQRLVGVTVIGLLAVIFVPFLFDGSAPERYEVVYDPPPAPTYEPTPLTSAEVRASMVAMVEESASAMPQRTASVVEDGEDGLALDADSLPVGWTIQLASFRELPNATRLRARLREATHQSYVLSQGEVHRVFVGPALEKARLEQIAADIEDKFELKGMVVRYRIEDDVFLVGG